VIHIHPFAERSAGPNARTGAWFDSAGLEVTDDSVTFPDGETWDEGDDTCPTPGGGTRPGQLVLARWASAKDAAGGEPPTEVATHDLGDVRFRQDEEYLALALVPEGETDAIAVREGILEDLATLDDADPPVSQTTRTSGTSIPPATDPALVVDNGSDIAGAAGRIADRVSSAGLGWTATAGTSVSTDRTSLSCGTPAGLVARTRQAEAVAVLSDWLHSQLGSPPEMQSDGAIPEGATCRLVLGPDVPGEALE
jgi:hypothetical protein